MTSSLRLRGFVLALILLAAIAPPLYAQATRQFTTTLLPVQSKANAAKGLWWIRQSTEMKVDQGRDLFLQFDLSSLPAGLTEQDITRATLRLVAEEVVYQPAGDPDTGGLFVSVKGQLATHDFSGLQGTDTVVALSMLTRKAVVAQQAPDELRRAVWRHYASADQKLSLRLFSESHKASTLLYSTASFGPTPSNIPRLVIEYRQGPADLREALGWPQHQRDPEHTGRSAWAPFQTPAGYSLARIGLPTIGGRAGGIADYALIHRGHLYIVYKVLDVNYLIALDFRGSELWRRDIGKGTVQRSPVISRDGTYYVATEDRVAGYDLNDRGRPVAAFSLPGTLGDFTDLTVGNDGSLFLAVRENEVHYIYGLTRELKPFLRAGPFEAGGARVSTVTVSADGREIAAQAKAGAVVIDIAEPARVRQGTLAFGDAGAFDYYHTPVAAPAGGIVIYSDFTSTANRGNVWGVRGSQRVWSAAGTLAPQPVLGSNGLLYFLQDGALKAHRYDQVGSAAITKGEGLNATSNLVMDGGNNIYFWDNGRLHGYGPDGQRLFVEDFTGAPGLERVRAGDPATGTAAAKADSRAAAAGPEQFIRLMLGADGTLWTHNRNGDALFAFSPSFAAADPVLAEPLQTRTVYRATGVLTVGRSAPLAAGAQVLLQGNKGISFPAGFAVERGASLLARTGM